MVMMNITTGCQQCSVSLEIKFNKIVSDDNYKNGNDEH